MLPQRTLGRTGIRVSALGFGTVKFGRNQGVKYPSPFDLPDDATAANLLAVAHDLGINLLDTAPAYGSSEARLGHLLQGQRDRWVICSKVGEEFSDGQSQFDFSPAHTRISIERSLQRLHTEVIDIVLVHSSGDDCAIMRDSGVIETLSELKREGKIRAVGVSTKTLEGGIRAAECTDAVMVTWNPQHTHEKPVLDAALAHGCGVLVKKAFASGHLNGDDAVQHSLDFVFSHPAVSSAIVGTLNEAHLRANAAAALRAIARNAAS
ncbi:MAG TPA: aldo/keto reductase [Pseudomonadales bacterium]|jgi:aryl-alcohol dehydrogenase-like predicted oxidoreductase